MTTPRRDRKRKGSPEWIRLGELLAARRAGLGPDYEGHGGRAAFARDRGVNLKLIQDIELNGRENFTPPTLRDAIAPAYGVTYESIRRALDGGELEPLPPPQASHTFTPPLRGRKLKALEDSDEPGLVPYLAEVAAEVSRAMDEHGPDLTGAQAFPDRPVDQGYWDNPRLSGYERVRLVARMRRMSAEGGTGQRDRSVSGLAPAWHESGADGAVPAERHQAGVT